MVAGRGGGKRSSGWKRRLSRRDFLRLGGAGLAGAALLGTAGCGGGVEQVEGRQTGLDFRRHVGKIGLIRFAPGFGADHLGLPNH